MLVDLLGILRGAHIINDSTNIAKDGIIVREVDSVVSGVLKSAGINVKDGGLGHTDRGGMVVG